MNSVRMKDIKYEKKPCRIYSSPKLKYVKVMDKSVYQK